MLLREYILIEAVRRENGDIVTVVIWWILEEYKLFRICNDLNY